MKHNKGFTLIELMIVVAIIGIIAMFAVPSYQNAQRKARITEGVAALTAAQSQIEKYRLTARKPYDDITLALAKVDENVKYSNDHIYTIEYSKLAKDDKSGQRYALIATSQGSWSTNSKCKYLHMIGSSGLITTHEKKPTSSTDVNTCLQKKTCWPISECQK